MALFSQLDLSNNQLCGLYLDYNFNSQGNYTAEGITAIAGALSVNGSLTKISLEYNYLTDDARDMLRKNVKDGCVLKL